MSRMLKSACIASSALAAVAATPASSLAGPVDWPSYNRTLTSNRFTPLGEISRETVGGLKVLCTYDTKEMTSFQSGLLEVGGVIYATTEHDTIAIDADTCSEKWRTHEDFPSSFLRVARGVAMLDGRLFRGGSDGKVRAYDAATGKLVWSRQLANPQVGETIPASPIAWNGMVFIGNAGGDNRGVRGRMYGLDAATGKVVWEFFLVPKVAGDRSYGPAAPGAPTAQKTSWKMSPGFEPSGGGTWTSYTLDPATGLLYVPGGNPAPDFVNAYRGGDNLLTGSVVVLDAKTGAYRRHVQLVRHDFHDWDVSSAPVLVKSAGKRMMIVTPKNGRLYGVDLKTMRIVYKSPVTTVENESAPLTPQGVRFCPGSQGGSEWNGAGYDQVNDQVVTGQVDWCTTVHTDPEDKVRTVATAQPWTGSTDVFGIQDDPAKWAGWLTASKASTGAKVWQFKAPYPFQGGVTPTAGGVVFAGDMGGNFYAFNTTTGAKLFEQNLGGAIGGGVISYDAGKGQKIAVAAGMTSPIWPTQKVTGRIVVLGLK